jgi:DNA-binding NtrC family response regulator
MASDNPWPGGFCLLRTPRLPASSDCRPRYCGRLNHALSSVPEMHEPSFPTDPILLVDDEEMVVAAMQTLLEAEGIDNTVTCTRSAEVPGLLARSRFSVVLLDLSMPTPSGLELLPVILEAHPELPVIVVTGNSDVEVAVRCMKAGAFDYVLKPLESGRYLTAVRRALEQRELGMERQRVRESFFAETVRCPEAFAGIVTRTPVMLAIFRYAEAIAPTSLPVLITGETGTGKELLARAVHEVSSRSGSFVAVNVAGLDDVLFSDTLFGHRRGAFTGATEDRPGMIRRAARGTLFLDEIGDLGVESQIKLLRLLQEREYHPLGEDAPRTTDARFIFATNLDLEKAASEGRFRKDLYYRLRSHRIHMPPLCERAADIPPLVDHLLDRAARSQGREAPRASQELYAWCRNRAFPGNVRELEGLIADAVLRHETGPLTPRDLGADPGDPSGEAAGDTASPNPFAPMGRLPTVDEAEQMLIRDALRRSGGNQTLAARMLGMSRTTLNKRLKREG